jgi:hypothetical protein
LDVSAGHGTEDIEALWLQTCNDVNAIEREEFSWTEKRLLVNSKEVGGQAKYDMMLTIRYKNNSRCCAPRAIYQTQSTAD